MHHVFILTITDLSDFGKLLGRWAFTTENEAITFGYDACKALLAKSAEPDLFDPHPEVDRIQYAPERFPY